MQESEKLKSLSPIRLLATPWTAAHQAPPSMGFSRQEYWSGVPLPSPGELLLISKTQSRYQPFFHDFIALPLSLLFIFCGFPQPLCWSVWQFTPDCMRIAKIEFPYRRDAYLIIFIILVSCFVSFCSVAQPCPTLCHPVDYSTPGFSVLHHLLELDLTHMYWFSDAIQPFHPLSFPSPPVFNLSRHQGLFQWVGSLHQVAKVLELQLQHQSFQWIFRTDFL